MVMITSARSATSLGEPQAVPPASSSGWGTPLRVNRNSSWPPLPRLSAMGWPMMPRPMKPTFMRDLPMYLAVAQALRVR